MIRRGHLAAAFVILAAAAGCGDGGGDDVRAAPTESAPADATSVPSPTPSSADHSVQSFTPAAESPPAIAPTPEPTPTTPATSTKSGDEITSAMGSGERLLLDRQAFLLEAGNGEDVDCDGNLHRIPRPFATAPAVWLDVRDEVGTVSPAEHVALCLHGFDPSAPIDITVTAGAFSARASAGTAVDPTGSYFLDSRTLFIQGAELGVAPEREATEFLMTGLWQFMPPQKAREELARTGRMEITAKQGAVQATYTQPFERHTSPGMEGLAGASQSDVRLAVWGFKPGTDVPVGLYRVGGTASSGGTPANLVEQLDTVTTDLAWAAEYSVPPRLLHRLPPGEYCISFPVGESAYCASASYWYPYPGEARPGDTGEVVHAWQVILAEAGEMDWDSIIGDDDAYSPDVEAVIRRLQASWGWTPDGIAGPGTYARLTGLPRPVEPTPDPE